MGYKLTFLEKEEETDIDGFTLETIEVTPSLNDLQMIALKPLTGRGSECFREGAKVESVSPDKIKIASSCSFCRKVLIQKIVQVLGTRINYLSIYVD